MRVAVRVDASAEIGVGHLSRCLTLAEVLRARGAQVEFVCREHPGHQSALVAAAGMALHALPAASESPSTAAAAGYARWLGVSQEEDAEQTLRAIADRPPDWLLVDHYALDARWESRVHARAARVMVIDDLGDRPHECQLLLDQNASPQVHARYQHLLPSDCERLLGVRYALIRPQYRQLRDALVRAARAIERVFVFFGGSDPMNLSGQVLEALSCPALRRLHVDVVVGANYLYGTQLSEQAAARPGTTLYGALPHLADLMAQADLAIGAAGTTTWERMCMGLPSLVISIAQNQEPGAEFLAQQGLIVYLGTATKVGVERIAAAVQEAIENPTRLDEQARRGRLLVDGLGALRVAESLGPTAASQLTLRVAQPRDTEAYFSWVNDPQVRRQSLNGADIAWQEHQRWFASKLADGTAWLFVLEARSLPVGQVRFDQDGDTLRVDYSIDSQFRGRGWGRALVALGMRQMAALGYRVFRAEVKAGNAPSRAVFERLNFRSEASGAEPPLRIFSYDARAQGLPGTD